LPTLGDPLLFDLCAGLPARWAADPALVPDEKARLTRRLRAVGPLPRVGAPPSEEEAVTLAALRALLEAAPDDAGAAAQEEEALLAAIYTDPLDDAPRAAFAAWLSARGDPRGRFIDLQLQEARGEAPSREARREMKSLLKRHEAAWCGPLAERTLKRGRAFRRGFVASCVGRVRDEEPAWSTVEHLESVVPGEALALPALRSLSLQHLTPLFDRRRPLAVEVLEWPGPGVRYGESAAETIEAFTGITCLPALRHLKLTGANGWIYEDTTRRRPSPMTARHFSWLWAAPTTSGLEALTLCANLSHLGSWCRALDARSRPLRLTLCGNYIWPYGWQVTLERGAQGQMSRLSVAPAQRRYRLNTLTRALMKAMWEHLLAGLADLPERRFAVDIHQKVDPEARAAIEATLGPRRSP